ITPTFTQGLELHDWQHECIAAWWREKRGIVKVVTGAGKTIVGLAIMERVWREVPDLRVAIVVPTIVLMNQWFEELRLRGNLPLDLIGRAGGGHNDSFVRGTRVLIVVLKTASKNLADDVAESNAGDELFLIVDEC